MILYDYRCADGHHFERMAELSDFDKAVPCKVSGCRKPAARVIVQAPGLHFRVIRAQEKTYHEHNITHEKPGSVVTALPNSPEQQCQCGDCSTHRRRASVTDVAEPGKNRYANG